MKNDTIFALSSAHGKSGVAIYRISGQKSLQILKSIAPDVKDIQHRFLTRTKIINPKNSEEIDDGMVVFFKAPFSFTGEDVIEIHTHGSIAIKKSLTETILSIDDVRYAEAGEFTKRAVLNDKMDLTKAEGLMDLINAETLIQQKQAIRQMRGALYDQCDNWRESILSIMSLLEAFIDFPDEEIPNTVLLDVEDKISKISSSLLSYLDDKRKGERLREGIRLAIYGKPNVGKSSLLNYLSKRNIAIVSDISGTTRDILESHIDINGYPIILIDTAGIHTKTKNQIELEGIRRAKIEIEEADIKIYMQDLSDYKIFDIMDENTIYVINKVDLNNEDLLSIQTNDYLKISIKKDIGLDKLIEKITEKASEFAGNGDSPTITRARHRAAIQKAYDALSRCDLQDDLVLAAENLRISARALYDLIGNIDVEEVLDKIFSTFCVGK